MPESRGASSSLRCLSSLLLLLSGFVTLGAGGPVRAAQFSADVLEHGPQGEISRGGIHVAGDLTRSELRPSPASLVRIYDRASGMEWVLHPSERTYIELKAGVQGAAGADPCRLRPQATCVDEGLTSESGRPVRQWRVAYQRHGAQLEMREWIDSDLGIPIREEREGGYVRELRNIRIGPQPPELFAVPPGYRLVKPLEADG